MDRFEFSHCSSPISFETFVSDYWEQQPLVVHRGDPDHYQGLFSTADLDHYLHLVRFDPEPGAILLANATDLPRPDKILGRAGSPETHLIMKSYLDGDSVVLNRMQRHWLPLAEMSRAWEATFRCPVSMSVYLTPPNAQGFPPHFEGHEVCVMQLEGAKTWKIYPPEIASSLGSREVKRSELTAAAREITLQAGDFLYLPRGSIHEGIASSAASLHLSALVRIYTWRDLIVAAVEEAANDQLLLRRSLPPGTLLESDAVARMTPQFEEIVVALTERLDPEKAVQRLEREFLLGQQPLPDGRFSSLNGLEAISSGTAVFRYAATLCSVTSDQSSAELVFGRNSVKGPIAVLPAFAFIAANAEFVVGDLPGLGDSARITLVRRLVSEGLLGMRAPNTSGS